MKTKEEITKEIISLKYSEKVSKSHTIANLIVSTIIGLIGAYLTIYIAFRTYFTVYIIFCLLMLAAIVFLIGLVQIKKTRTARINLMKNISSIGK